MNRAVPTPESLARDRSHHRRERDELAAAYERAADVLDRDSGDHTQAARFLREEAARWRK